MISQANFERGLIFEFNCCCEGKHVLVNYISGKKICKNQDGVEVENEWHPFLIISEGIKNNSSDSDYLTVLPITSSKSNYNQINGVPLTKDMIATRGEALISRGSIIKIDTPLRIFKKHLKNACYAGDIQIGKPYLKLIYETLKSIGGSELAKEEYKQEWK